MKKVLIVITNHDAYPSKEEGTGLWLSELTHFYEILKKEGYKMDFASPEGGEIPLDQRSLGRFYMDQNTRAYYNDPQFMQRLKETIPVDEVDWEDYRAIFYTGGHGTMWDFPENETLQGVSRNIYENGGVVAAVCHGNAGLVNIKLSNDNYLITGKEVTGFSNIEETLSLVRKEVPFLLEDEIKARGAKYKKAFLPFTSHAIVDGRLVTGQNPQSTKAVAERVVALLKTQGQ